METLTYNEIEGSRLPPFPDDVPTAPLLRLSLRKLVDNNVEESNRFFRACTDLGFFYLDLRDASSDLPILENADALFDVAESFFDLSVEEKGQYDFSGQNSYFGYTTLWSIDGA